MTAGKRLGASLLLSLVPVLGQRIPLPGVDLDADFLRETSLSHRSAFALGASPLLSAYLAVEGAALLVPRWRPLRHDFPAGRAKLERAVTIVALILTAFQGFGLALTLEGVAEEGTGAEVSRSLVVLTLIGATSFMLLLTRQIERLGMFSGVLGLVLALEAARAVEQGFQGSVPRSAWQLAFMLTLYALPPLLTWGALRGWSPQHSTARPWLPVPVGSLQPLNASHALLGIPAALYALEPFSPLEILAGLEGHVVARLLLPLALTGLFGYCLQAPGVVAALVANVRACPADVALARRSLQRAWWPSLLVIAALAAVEQLTLTNGWPSLVVPSALSTALLLDGAQAFRVHRERADLGCVWRERRPYLLPELLDLARSNGIAVGVTGLAQTSLLRFFGPYTSVGLWCQRSEVTRAHLLIAERLEGRAEPEPAAEPPVALEPGKLRPRSIARPMLVAFATLTALLFALSYSYHGGLMALGTRVTNTRASFQIVGVEDKVDYVRRLEHVQLPPGLSLRYERLPNRDDDDVVTRERYLLRLQPTGGETLSQALERLAPELATLELPPNRRLLWEHEDEHAFKRGVDDSLEPFSDGESYRSFVGRTPPLVSARDLLSADIVSGPGSSAAVALRLATEASERLREYTSGHVGQRLAMVVDGLVVSAPIIQSEIKGGVVQVQLGLGAPEDQRAKAERLVAQLTEPPRL